MQRSQQSNALKRLARENMFFDIIVQTYNAGLRSMRHPVELGERPSASTTCEISRVLQCLAG